MIKGLVPTYLETSAKHPRGELPSGDGPGAGAVSELAPVIIVIIIIQCRSATIRPAAGILLVHFVARRAPAPVPGQSPSSAARYFIIPSNGANCVCFFAPTATLICLLQLPAIEAEDL